MMMMANDEPQQVQSREECAYSSPFSEHVVLALVAAWSSWLRLSFEVKVSSSTERAKSKCVAYLRLA